MVASVLVADFRWEVVALAHVCGCIPVYPSMRVHYSSHFCCFSPTARDHGGLLPVWISQDQRSDRGKTLLPHRNLKQ